MAQQYGPVYRLLAHKKFFRRDRVNPLIHITTGKSLEGVPSIKLLLSPR